MFATTKAVAPSAVPFSRLRIRKAPTVGRGLVLDAVLMAVRRRRPNKAIIHADQGSQYGSDDWQRFCRTNGLIPSMSRRGNCWDNAVAESFFGSLKKEHIKKRIYKNRAIACAEIAEYIDAFTIPPDGIVTWVASVRQPSKLPAQDAKEPTKYWEVQFDPDQ
jgi:putative transposase